MADSTPPTTIPEEGLLVFRIDYDTETSKAVQKAANFPLDHPDLSFEPLDTSGSQMRKTGCCDDDLIEQLWDQKNRMDQLFDSGLSQCYYEARAKLWPSDGHGSATFWNRAGDKLNEVHSCQEVKSLFEGFEKEEQINFLDVCGGPGAFSQFVFDKTKSNSKQTIGFGITLSVSLTPESDIWYQRLLAMKNFTACSGVDKTGNVYVPDNLQSVYDTIQQCDKIPVDEQGIRPIHLVVSDGGFEIKKVGDAHMENFQEIFSCRIILSELLMALKALRHGGHFVCKLFDTFSYFMQSLIYVVTQVFEETWIVKPRRSRLVNSERYLVGKFLKKNTKEEKERWEFFFSVLDGAHRRWYKEDSTPEKIMKTLVPLQNLTDPVFSAMYSKMTTKICLRQTNGIKLVMDEAEKLAKDPQPQKRRRSYPDFRPNKHQRRSDYDRPDRSSNSRNRSFGHHDQSHGYRRDDHRDYPRDSYRTRDRGGYNPSNYHRDEDLRRRGARNGDRTKDGNRSPRR